jgi:RNA polymerase sigma factor (sigma-70 family)
MRDLDPLLPAIVAGDSAAFGQWMSAAEPPLRASLRSYAARVDTEAVIQEALLRVWQFAPRHAPDGLPNSLLRFAMRVARNLCIDELRRARVSPMDDDGIERAIAQRAEGQSESAPDPFLREVIAGCRDKLPAKPAEVLSARLESAGGEPDLTIAERLGMQLNTFLQNVTRARRFLAECLKRQNVDLEAELR